MTARQGESEQQRIQPTDCNRNGWFVALGRYRSTSEVIRAGLRLVEDQETTLAGLRGALVAGEASGEPESFDFDAFTAMKRS
jgi:antitoxin ParD1/3/4